MTKLIDKYILSKLYNRRLMPYVSFWARFVLRIRKPTIIGITGSAGKTTCTEMIAAILTHEKAEPMIGYVAWTSLNMNNDYNLPLTVLLYPDPLPSNNFERFAKIWRMPFRALKLATVANYPKILVLEYGAGWTGHLDHLARLVPPSIAVVTTIGPAHLERLKTVEGVAREKSALVRAVPPWGLVLWDRTTTMSLI